MAAHGSRIFTHDGLSRWNACKRLILAGDQNWINWHAHVTPIRHGHRTERLINTLTVLLGGIRCHHEVQLALALAPQHGGSFFEAGSYILRMTLLNLFANLLVLSIDHVALQLLPKYMRLLEHEGWRLYYVGWRSRLVICVDCSCVQGEVGSPSYLRLLLSLELLLIHIPQIAASWCDIRRRSHNFSASNIVRCTRVHNLALALASVKYLQIGISLGTEQFRVLLDGAFLSLPGWMMRAC